MPTARVFLAETRLLALGVPTFPHPMPESERGNQKGTPIEVSPTIENP